MVTGSAVIWSQGGVIRRVFRYDVEKEPVIQAVLTWFSSDDPQDAVVHAHGSTSPDDDGEGRYINGPEGNKRKIQDWPTGGSSKKRVSTWNSKSRTYAAQLGNFPKARGVSTGGMGAGPASTTGDIEDEGFLPGKVRALVVFLKTQAFVYFLSGTSHVIHLPFEVEYAMPAPHGLILQRKPPAPSLPPPGLFSTGNSFSARPIVNTIKESPRLFSLTDPLLEVGLIVTSSNTPSTEDLIFISPSSELDPSIPEENPGSRFHSPTNPEIIFAVTRNPERSQITIWNVRYIPQEPPTNVQRRTPSVSGTASRRRSSFGPGTGGTTPVTSGGGPGSIASTSTIVGGRDSLGPSDVVSLPDLGDDFGGKRSSRRVSSLVARADLSGNNDRQGRFSDVSGSLGASFGSSMPPPPNNSMHLDNDQPVDELLNELNMGALGIGMGGLGIYDGEGLRNEVLMTRLESYAFKSSSNEEPNGRPARLPRVFTLHAPSSLAAAAAAGKGNGGKKVVLCIMNQEEGTLLLVTFLLQIHPSIPRGYSRKSSSRFGTVGVGYTPVVSNVEKRRGVLDAIKMEDHGASRILILTDEGEMNLYSPWGPIIQIVLPPTLTRWNTNVIGEDGSRRGIRKKGFARTLSTSPERYERLEYSEIGGRVTVIDGDGIGHRISITLAPRETAIKACLETCRVILAAGVGPTVGEWMWAGWIELGKWLSVNNPESIGVGRQLKVLEVDEWRAFVVTLFLIAVPSLPEQKPPPRRKSAGFVRSASIMAAKEWEDLVTSEGEWGSRPEYLKSPAWSWMVEEEDDRILAQMAQHTQATPKSRIAMGASPEPRKMNEFIKECIFLARDFTKTPMGQAVQDELHANEVMVVEQLRKQGLACLLVALHLLREEWKLDVTMEGAGRRLCPVLRQLATWLGWREWVDEYMLEDVEMSAWKFDESTYPRIPMMFLYCTLCADHMYLARITAGEVPSQPGKPHMIYDWLIGCLESKDQGPFMMLQDIVAVPVSSPTGSHYSTTSQYRARNPFSPPPMPPPLPTQKRVFARLTPRTRVITELYTTLTTPGSGDVDVVARMVELKMNTASLEKLPEGIAVPLREAIARCQEQPPTTWGVQALDLVGRKDLRMLIDPGKGRKEGGSKWQSVRTTSG